MSVVQKDSFKKESQNLNAGQLLWICVAAITFYIFYQVKKFRFGIRQLKNEAFEAHV